MGGRTTSRCSTRKRKDLFQFLSVAEREALYQRVLYKVLWDCGIRQAPENFWYAHLQRRVLCICLIRIVPLQSPLIFLPIIVADRTGAL